MTIALGPYRVATLLGFSLVAAAAKVGAQSLLDRPPNVSGGWVVRPGVIQFNFLHRFVRSDAPERKVSNFPTFLLGTGLPGRSMIGFHYATNSTLAPRFPNEWEFFGRVALVQQERGSPVDAGLQVGYNLAADGLDGEASVARRLGPVRLVGAVRALSDPFVADHAQVAVAAGATVRVRRWLALAGDAASLTERSAERDEKVAWSAGIHLAIPNTPHTLSLHVTNTNTATLQGLSRGTARKRYGFEFTIPVTLARYFGRRPAPPPAPPVQAEPLPPAGTPRPPGPSAKPGAIVRISISGFAFNPAQVDVAPGTTVEWTNNDQVEHTVTSADGRVASPLIPSGGTWRTTIGGAGTVAYSCTPHPFMKGTVIVK